MFSNRDRKSFPKNLDVPRPGAQGYAKYFEQHVPERGPTIRVNIMRFCDPRLESLAVQNELKRRAEAQAEIRAEIAELNAMFLADAQASVDHTRWGPTRRLVAHEYVRGIEKHGVRYELNAKELARKLGRVISTINDHIRALRKEGFLQHHRKHYIDWKKTESAREAAASNVDDPETIFCSARAVHEPGPSFPRSGAMFRSRLSDLLDGLKGLYPTGTSPLTWKDSPDG